MSLSRLFPSRSSLRLVAVPFRVISTSPTSSAVGGWPDEKPEEMDNPSLWQKIVLRFKGIPLKGEVHPPRSMFSDVDKEWFAPKSLPEVPRDYKEYPERDIVNFPYPARRMYPPKTRLLMIPDSWCTPFYKVTGVSGPYLFFGGMFAFLLNKELYVLEEQAHMLCGWIIFYLLLSRTIGYRVDKWLYGEYIKRMDHFKELIEEDLKGARDFRTACEAESQSLQAMKERFPIVLRETMALQLEAAYRENVQKVATEMKRRIDYLQETEATKSRFEQEHMLKWIINGALAEIKGNKDGVKDKYLDKCITELKTLSTAAA